MPDKLIMLIEDNKAIRESLTWTIESAGYNIKPAANGQEAFNLIDDHKIIPSLILLDMMMPIMDGWEFREKQKAHPHINDTPTIIMTAQMNIKSKLRKYENEILMLKPFDVDELLNHIKNFCS